MTKFNYKYNELAYAEDILKNGFTSQYYRTELRTLVKYWKHLNIKPAQRKTNLYEFCEKNIEGFTREEYYKVINSALNYAKKKGIKLVIIKSLPITKNEFEYINNIDMEIKYKRILFSYLVKTKLNKMICMELYGESSKFNFYGGSRRHYNEIKDMSNIKRGENLNYLNGDLANKGFIDICNKGKVRLSFMDEIIESDEVDFIIKDFDLVYGYFDFYSGDNSYIICEECGKLVKRRGNKGKYCVECARELQLKWQRESMNRLRS